MDVGKKEILVALFCIPLIPLVALPIAQKFTKPIGDLTQPTPRPTPRPTPEPAIHTSRTATPAENAYWAKVIAELKKPWKWSGKIDSGPEGPTTYLGDSPQENPRAEQMSAAAPWILCKIVKLYPPEKSSNRVLSVTWATGLLSGSSGADISLRYDRHKKTLIYMGFGFGGGHGTDYDGVTDEKLLQLEKEARRNGTRLSLEDLTGRGCTAESF